jgi:ketosteroid isomerase-like protein
MKNMIAGGLLLATLLFLLPSCKPGESHDQPTPAAINMDSVTMQITAMEKEYERASNARDVDAVVKYFAADAQSLANNEPTRVGIDSIRAGVKRDIDSTPQGVNVTFNVTGVWADGKYATETGTFVNTDSTGTVLSSGKYMTLFELRDGKYIAIRDIWNNDKKSN